MRVVGIVALSSAALVAGTAFASPVLTAARPQVRVSDLNPFTVRGANFKSRERVRVVITSKKHRTTRTVTANGRGIFRTVFTFKLRGCDEYGVRATGGDGSRAAVKSSQQSCGADIGPV